MDEDKNAPATPQPIYETIFESEPGTSQPTTPPNEVPSQPPIASEPEIVPEEIGEEATPETFKPPLINLDDAGEGASNKTRFIIIGAALFFFVLIFFGLFLLVRGLGGAPVKKVSLEYWGLWEDKAIMDPIIKEYERQNKGVTIHYDKKDPHSYREKLLTRSKEGNGPDIFRFHNTWLPTIKDVLAPLPKTIMSNSEYESTFYPVTKKDLKVGDTYFGIPLEIDGLVLLYNDDLFKTAGIQVAPKTWNDILNYSAKITVAGPSGIVTSGIALGTAENINHFSEILGWMMLQAGAKLSDLSSSEAVDILSSYERFAQAPDPRWDENMPNSTTAFIQGKVGMIIVPSWEILPIKTVAPDLNFKVAPLPVVPGNKQISLADYWVEGVSRYQKPENQQAAWKFLRYLSQKDTMVKMYELATKTRIFGEPYSRVDLASKLAQDKYIGPVIMQANVMQSLPVMSRTYDNGLNDAIVGYLKNAVNDTVKGVSAQEAFDTAGKGITEVFNRFDIK